jgi:hypothetical protein
MTRRMMTRRIRRIRRKRKKEVRKRKKEVRKRKKEVRRCTEKSVCRSGLFCQGGAYFCPYLW